MGKLIFSLFLASSIFSIDQSIAKQVTPEPIVLESDDVACKKMAVLIAKHKAFMNNVTIRVGRQSDSITQQGYDYIAAFEDYLRTLYRENHGGQECK